MNDKQKEFLEQSGFDEGVRMSKIHSDCEEFQSIIDEIGKLLIELQKRMFEHHENCNRR